MSQKEIGQKEKGNKQSGKKENVKREVAHCYGCGDAEKASDNALTCDQGHYLHGGDCLRNFFRVALAQDSWTISIPIKCAICRTDYYPHLLEAVMTPSELEVYQTAILFVGISVGDKEIFVNCPFCKYGAVADKKDVPVLFFCEGPKCKKRSCTICRKEVTDRNGEEHLTKCVRYGKLYEQFTEIIEQGMTVPCPGCGLRGMKNENCNHMSCPRCKTNWCYCCGRDETKAARGSSEQHRWPLAHNMEWKVNLDRCPVYLQEFKEVDPNFPEQVGFFHSVFNQGKYAARESLETFHRQRTLRMLRRKVAEAGREEVARMLAQFPQALGGFTLKDIEDRPMKWCQGRRLGDAPPQ